jgi:hypothetical protein
MMREYLKPIAGWLAFTGGFVVLLALAQWLG